MRQHSFYELLFKKQSKMKSKHGSEVIKYTANLCLSFCDVYVLDITSSMLAACRSTQGSSYWLDHSGMEWICD